MSSLSFGSFTWHEHTSPEIGDLRVLQQNYKFHELDIEDCLSEHERPKIDEYDHYLFLVLHIPYTDEHSGRIYKEEVNIFLGREFVVTVHDGNIEPLNELWRRMKASKKERDAFLDRGPGFFLYTLISTLFDHGFPQIDGIYKALRRIERELFETDEETDLLREIMMLKRNIITMRSIILPQRAVVAALEHKNKKFVPESLEVYFDDVLDAIERQWSLLETAKEVGEALQDTHESWISYRTNAIIRVLTLFSVTMLPLNFITGLYGMNVHLPYSEHPLAFFALTSSMLLVVIVAFSYFAWKKWF